MEIGMIGLGRMGANMVRRLIRAGHTCIVYDIHPEPGIELAKEGAIAVGTPQAFAARLKGPRAVWMMVPAAVVDVTLKNFLPVLQKDDVIIDGGNSHYHDDIRRAADLEKQGLHYLDVGTSGGVFGLDRGYCLMIGGTQSAFKRLEPIFASLAPGAGSIPRTPGRIDAPSTAQLGYLHCGPSGAGHFVKMVHNGIEYGLMAAYAEGINILKHANVGKLGHAADAETTPLRNPEHYQFDMNVAEISELWRRGSVISSWLLDLTAAALQENPDLSKFSGNVSDSGEGRWTINAAIDEAVPTPVLSAALYQRFSSRNQSDFADKLLSALRYQFGGHAEKTSPSEGSAR